MTEIRRITISSVARAMRERRHFSVRSEEFGVRTFVSGLKVGGITSALARNDYEFDIEVAYSYLPEIAEISVSVLKKVASRLGWSDSFTLVVLNGEKKVISAIDLTPDFDDAELIELLRVLDMEEQASNNGPTA